MRGDYRLTFATLCLAALSFSLLQSLVIPVMPVLREKFGVGQETITWLLTGYLLAASIATPILGRIGDMFGKSRTLLLTMIVFAGGTLFAALADDIGTLIAARIVQGVGGALFPLAFGIIRDEFPKEKVPGALGMISAMLAIGGALGIAIAGPIVELLNVHWLFWIPFGMISLASVAIWRFIPESPVRAPGRINWLAAILLSAWMTCFLVAVSLGNSLGWVSPPVLLGFVGTVIFFILWVVVERVSRVPLIDIAMVVRGPVLIANLLALAVGCVMYATFTILPSFLQSDPSTGYGFGLSVTGAGLLLLPQTIINFLCGFYAGRLERWIGSRGMMLIGCVATASGLLVILFWHTEPWYFVLVGVFFGVGLGMTIAALPNLVVQAVSPEETGAATGVNNNMRTIGGAIGGQVVAAVLTLGVVGAIPPLSHYLTAFGILAAIALASVALIVPYVIRRPPSSGLPRAV